MRSAARITNGRVIHINAYVVIKSCKNFLKFYRPFDGLFAPRICGTNNLTSIHAASCH